uniref:Auxin-responsive protein n=1 Tax=Setaria viridis TaxID=4556 RepID=A0A4U6UHU0_SETVI|nr:hypothetical protein SEVIR_5G215300v2 [Setaria viridis]
MSYHPYPPANSRSRLGVWFVDSGPRVGVSGVGLLVHDEEGGAETRVLVRVKDLKEPCMAGLLEMAEQQFGYGQQGVLRVPCDAQRFEHVVNMARKSKAAR